MTREETTKAVKVMKAYANGKEIQYLDNDNEWIDVECPSFDWDKCVYRIKPELEYRPFESQKECWEEMHKHSDFGWVVNKNTKSIYHINAIWDETLSYGDGETFSNYLEALNYYEFVDGTPFGVKKEL